MEGNTPKPHFNMEDYIETREYQIKFDDNKYNILIGLTSKSIIFRTLHYKITINKDEFNLYACDTNEDLFNLFNSVFKNNKVIIKNVIPYQEIILILYFTIKGNKEEQYEISMCYENENIEHITNYLWNKLIEQNKKLNQKNEEVKILKDNYNIIINEINDIKRKITTNNNIGYFKDTHSQNYSLDNNINNFNNKDSQNNFYILIKESGREGIITLENCYPSQKISDLMNKYKDKIKNPFLNFYFLYNTKILEPNKTLEEANLANLETIEVIKNNS